MLCVKCENKFSYKEILKAAISYKISCKTCKQEYKVTNLSRLIIAILVALPLFFINNLINTFDYYIIILYVLYCISIALISPLFVKIINR
ncbi:MULTISPECIES: TIGR04104 family putative zinc finger protein [unclassified Clostridium]|uniref:TIGR04104 family putative zinc finger protein n=1 Tax=unclassified Clostridium TaxID=2614128 RepID=UPI003216F7AD